MFTVLTDPILLKYSVGCPNIPYRTNCSIFSGQTSWPLLRHGRRRLTGGRGGRGVIKMRKVVNPYSIREGNEQMQWRIIRVVVLSIALVFLWSMLAPHPKPYDKTEVQKIEKESTTQDTLTMAIMSFNLRFANEDDGINSWRFRREHVFDIINRYHPVVMGIQEGLHDQLTDLHENLNWPYERYGLPREDDGGHVDGRGERGRCGAGPGRRRRKSKA